MGCSGSKPQTTSTPAIMSRNNAGNVIDDEGTATDEMNREILRRLRKNDTEALRHWEGYDGEGENDPCLDDLTLCEMGSLWMEVSQRPRADPNRAEGTVWPPKDTYNCREGRDLVLLGEAIGCSKLLKVLWICLGSLEPFDTVTLEQFCEGVNQNRSVQRICFWGRGDAETPPDCEAEVLRLLRPFFENNASLLELEVSYCWFNTECARQFALAMESCRSSLRRISISCVTLEDGPRALVINSLVEHPQLKDLELSEAEVDWNFVQLSDVLKRLPMLRGLTLECCEFGDNGVDALVNAAENMSRLTYLRLNGNGITARGCRRLATLLENKNCNVESLYLGEARIGADGVRALANAMAVNRTLSLLEIGRSRSDEEMSSFRRALCDTSSVDATYLSNHILGSYGIWWAWPAPSVRSLVRLNTSSRDTKVVAMRKIVTQHRDIVMSPFFEWDLKVLPLALERFQKAASPSLSVHPNGNAPTYDEQIASKKLSAIYQFVRAMPDLSVKGAKKREAEDDKEELGRMTKRLERIAADGNVPP